MSHMLLDDVRIEVNGLDADPEMLALIECEGWGHFTVMQVRDRRTRGLDFHLTRLDEAQRAIYGHGLDGDLVRARVRHALGGLTAATVRVYGYWAGVIVTVRGPKDMPARPHTMTAQHFQRPLARLKHVGSWAQGHFRELAIAAGFDEGLLVDETGRISEGTVTNVAVWRDDAVVWPDGPKLDGITMLVLRRELAARGVPQADESVRLADLPGCRGMIMCNSRGWATVCQVDDIELRSDDKFAALVSAAYDRAPLDVI